MKLCAPAFLLLTTAALTGCRSLPPPTPLAQLDAQQMRGHAVYGAHCAQCHYDRREGALHGPTLYGLFRRPTLPSGAAPTDERVTATIVHGRGMMPAQGQNLSDAELGDLLAYLHTL